MKCYRSLFAVLLLAVPGALLPTKPASSSPLTIGSLGPEHTPFGPTTGLLPSKDLAYSGACSHTECLVVWAPREFNEADETRWMISMVGLDGKLLSSTPQILTRGQIAYPMVASSGDTYMLVWRTSEGLMFRQMNAEGKWIQPAALALPAARSTGIAPRLMWAGSEFLLIAKDTELTAISLSAAGPQARTGRVLVGEDIVDVAWFQEALWVLGRRSGTSAPAQPLLLHRLTLNGTTVTEAGGSPTELAKAFDGAAFLIGDLATQPYLMALITEPTSPPVGWRLVAHKITKDGVLSDGTAKVLASESTGPSPDLIAINGSRFLLATGDSVRRFDVDKGWIDDVPQPLVSSSNDHISLLLPSPRGWCAFASPPNAATQSRDVCVRSIDFASPMKPIDCDNAVSVGYVGQRYLGSAVASGSALVAFADEFASGFKLGRLGPDLEGSAVDWSQKDTHRDFVSVENGRGGFRVLWRELSSVPASNRSNLAVVASAGSPILQDPHELDLGGEVALSAWHDDRGLIVIQLSKDNDGPLTVVYTDDGRPVGLPLAIAPLPDIIVESVLKSPELGANADSFLLTWVAYPKMGKQEECRLVFDRFDRQGQFKTRSILPPTQSDCHGGSGRRVFAQDDGSYLVVFTSTSKDHLNLIRVPPNGVATPLGSVRFTSAAANEPYVFAAADGKVVVLGTKATTLSGGVVNLSPTLSAEPFSIALPQAIAKPALHAWAPGRLLLTYESFDATFAVTTIRARLIALDGAKLTPEPADVDAGVVDALGADAASDSGSNVDPGQTTGDGSNDENAAANDGCGCSIGSANRRAAWPVFVLIALVIIRAPRARRRRREN